MINKFVGFFFKELILKFLLNIFKLRIEYIFEIIL